MNYTEIGIILGICLYCCSLLSVAAYLFYFKPKQEKAKASIKPKPKIKNSGTTATTAVLGTMMSTTPQVTLTTPAPTNPPTCSGSTSQYTFPFGNTLKPGQTLTQCQGLKSKNGAFILCVQSDGNLVVWDTQSKDGIWSSNTYGASVVPYRLVYELGGNVVLLGGPGHVLWSTGTSDSTKLMLHNDGHLVVYNGNSRVWSSTLMDCAGSTAQWRVPYGDKLQRGYTLSQCSALKSPDGKVLAVQSDGNLMMWDGNNGVWSSNTAGAGVGPYRLVYEAGGNIVLFDEADHALWSTYTHGKASTQLVLHKTGHFAVYNGNNPIWSSMLMDCGGSAAKWRYPYGSTMKPGDMLPQCSALKSDNGKVVWAVQSDGNVNIWDGNTGVWSSNTAGAGTGPYRLVYEAGGNVVLFDEVDHVLWSTNTGGKASKSLFLLDSNDLVLANDTALGVWRSKPFHW